MLKYGLLMLMLLLVAPAGAQGTDYNSADPPERTGFTAGALNGAFWARLTPENKLGFLIGFIEGVHLSFRADKYKTPFKYGEFVNRVDRFYRQQESRLPIDLAIRIVILESRGASEREIVAEFNEGGRPVITVPVK